MKNNDVKQSARRQKGGSFFSFLGFAGAFLAIAAVTWWGLSVMMPKLSDGDEASEGADPAEIEAEQKRRAEELEAKRKADLAEKNRLAAEKAKAEKLERERLKKEAARILKEKELARQKKLKAVQAKYEQAMEKRDWGAARLQVNSMLDYGLSPEKSDALYELLDKKEEEDKQQILAVNKILAQVRELDNGQRSAKALSLLEKAFQIMPEHPDVAELKKKMSAYPFEIHVPRDVASIDEALPMLQNGDSLIIGEGTFYCSAELTKKVIIKGSGKGKTILECDTTAGTALHFAKGSEGSTVSSLSLQGMLDENDADKRFALVLLEADVTISNVDVSSSTGHGLAVLSGRLSLDNAKIHGNYWDGINLKGKTASAVIKNCEIKGNYEHGVDAWLGAQLKLSDSDVSGNSGTGIVILGEGSLAHLSKVKSHLNRQAGIMISNGAKGKFEQVTAEKNILSGVVIQGRKTKVDIAVVTSNRNGEAGFIIDPSSTVEGYSSAITVKNAKGSLVRKSLIPVAQPAP